MQPNCQCWMPDWAYWDWLEEQGWTVERISEEELVVIGNGNWYEIDCIYNIDNGIAYGNGYGYGTEISYGEDYGHGYAIGNGFGYGNGNGVENGFGHGYGNGNGTGHGDGAGD